MIESRTLTSHTYNEDLADDIADKIAKGYFPEFAALRAKLESLRKETP